MTIQQLKYMDIIAKEGSLNKAAEKLYVSQPSLSSAITELEKEIGIVIFNRSGRGATLTNDGMEFIQYARQVVHQYEILHEKYIKDPNTKKKFGISTQHYSFAVKSFVDLVSRYDISKYEFAIRETKTKEVIDDVNTGRSELGIIYMSEFNEKPIKKILKSNSLVFTPLVECKAFVYLWKGHPLAKKKKIKLEELLEYPCLSFEQGVYSSFYFAEELLSTNEYPKLIKANDRATMLNLMIGLNGYTLCSGIICEELNGSDYLTIPFEIGKDVVGGSMNIGYIHRKNAILSDLANMYIEEMKKNLNL
ncbi:MAG: LysR family transcriptional regulator [Lachnospiraceae bacterium]|nr:LysR family transcriptional regulator [Lachnospiraceae bacterium]